MTRRFSSSSRNLSGCSAETMPMLSRGTRLRNGAKLSVSTPNAQRPNPGLLSNSSENIGLGPARTLIPVLHGALPGARVRRRSLWSGAMGRVVHVWKSEALRTMDLLGGDGDPAAVADSWQ